MRQSYQLKKAQTDSKHGVIWPQSLPAVNEGFWTNPLQIEVIKHDKTLSLSNDWRMTFVSSCPVVELVCGQLYGRQKKLDIYNLKTQRKEEKKTYVCNISHQKTRTARTHYTYKESPSFRCFCSAHSLTSGQSLLPQNVFQGLLWNKTILCRKLQDSLRKSKLNRVRIDDRMMETSE